MTKYVSPSLTVTMGGKAPSANAAASDRMRSRLKLWSGRKSRVNELARLSVHDDHDATLRRLVTAADRDPSGRALAAGLELLREADMPVEALGLGVGHWRVKEHDPEVVRHLVLGAIEAGRPLEAKQYLAALDQRDDVADLAGLRSELAAAIAQAQQTLPGA